MIQQCNGRGLSRRIAAAVVRAAPCATVLVCVASCASTGSEKAFPTPQAGTTALIQSLRRQDVPELRAILGPEAEELIDSGDAIADANQRHEFLEAYDRAHRVVVDEAGRATLLVGTGEWPFPIPLVQQDAGWTFDTAKGKEEILARRIGRNELAVIEVCRAIVDAQEEYADLDADHSGRKCYARRFVSQAGKHDGLYWEARAGEATSPLGELVADAAADGYALEHASAERPFHGYFFHMLDCQGPAAPGGEKSYVDADKMPGGFGVVAWPAAYDNTGVKTFLVSHSGIVYEKDLGEDTQRIAAAIKAFDPSEGWEIVP